MNTDREQLEWAAKAVGMNTPRYVKDGRRLGWAINEGISVESGPTSQRLWNPLTDDGDALRLFCALPWMAIETSDVGVTVRERGSPDEPSRVYLMWTEWLYKHNGDLAAATRHVIVRAAAEIGKRMKNT